MSTRTCSMPPSADRRAIRSGARRFCVGIVVDRNDWHARELSKALRALGAATTLIRLDACAFATASASGLMLDGFDDRLPDAVFVRTVAGGSFESVTLRLGVLHALRDLGVTVWNDARAIERCVDKSMTSFLLARAGIPTPETWVTESQGAAAAIVRREASPLVLKPLFGSQGRGLKLIRTPADLPSPPEVAGVYYLQRYVAVERDGFRDFRLLVSKGRVVAAMARHAASWITNVKQGGRPMAVIAGNDLKELAIR